MLSITAKLGPNVFKCPIKLNEHARKYERYHTDPTTAQIARMSLASLVSKHDLVTQCVVEADNNYIEELYTVLDYSFRVKIRLKCINQGSIFSGSVKNPDTYNTVNKILAKIETKLNNEELFLRVKQFFTILMRLYDKGYIFNCDYDDGHLDLRFESGKAKSFIEVTCSF